MPNEPRPDRRSSPSAPQGAVVVTAVLVIFLAVIGVLAGTFANADERSSARTTTTSSSMVVAAPQGAAPDRVASTTTLPVRRGATTLFVTTTEWVTTTSSTTTTEPGKGALDVRGGPLELEPGNTARLRVANTGTSNLRWAVASSSTGVTVQPASGLLSPAQTASVSVAARSNAQTGTATLTFFSDGGVTTVRVVVATSSPDPALVISYLPATPTCAAAVTVRVDTRDTVASLTGQYSVGAGGVANNLTFQSVSAQRWVASIPPQIAGSKVNVSVTARDAGGDSLAQVGSSYTVSPGFGGAC